MISSRNGVPHVPGEEGPAGERVLFAAGIVLGITSISTQIIFLREILSVFFGNELIIGVVLANWMILTGTGTFVARMYVRSRERPPAIPVLFILLAVFPSLTVFILRFARNVVFTPGSMIGVTQALLSSFVLLAPFCLTSGFAFTILAVTISNRRKANTVGKMYAWESLGSAIGGIVFNILLITFLKTFQALGVLLVIDLGMSWLMVRRERRRVLQGVIAIVFCAGVAVMSTLDPDDLTRGYLFPGQEILAVRDTPYGSLTVTRQTGQVNLFENGVLLTSSDDVTADEENVHYALVQRGTLRNVLLVGGGITGTTREALKYGCTRVDYVEINPWIVDATLEFAPAVVDSRVRIINEDARTYIRRTPDRYDAVLLNLPDPVTAQLNRYSTVEFFREVRGILTAGGVLATGLLPGAEYQGREARRSGSVLSATLRQVFPRTLIIPGMRNFFLASDSTLDIRIASLIEARGVGTQYVNKFYIDDTLLEQRSREITASLGDDSPVNMDFRPLSYYRQLAYWSSYFGFNAVWLVVVAVAIWCVAFLRAGPAGAGILAGGTAAASVQVLLLMAFQTLCGSLYQMTGFLITAFMAGLAVGAGPLRRVVVRGGMRLFIRVQLAVALECILLWPILAWLHSSDISLAGTGILFTLGGFAVATLIGLEFSAAVELFGADKAAAASSLYGLDLLGSALGALAVSIYVLPRFGLIVVTILACLVSVVGAARCALSQRQFAGACP